MEDGGGQDGQRFEPGAAAHPSIPSTHRLLGICFGAGLSSATVAALAARSTLAAEAVPALTVGGATIGALFSSLIAAHALSWPSVALAVAGGAGAGMVAWTSGAGSAAAAAACWVAALLSAALMGRQPPELVRPRTSPGLVAVIHFAQGPLIAYSAAISLLAPAPRPYVIVYTFSAFALWRRLGGDCPISRAELELRALRGEPAAAMRDAGFVGHHLRRLTGVVIPRGFVARVAYTLAGLTFTWYAIDTFR
jgi:hypothetical protein